MFQRLRDINKSLCGEMEDIDYTFHYSVEEYVTTFAMDKNKTEPFTNTENFYPDKHGSLAEAFNRASIKYVEMNINAPDRFILPIKQPEEFVMGAHSLHSLTLNLIITTLFTNTRTSRVRSVETPVVLMGDTPKICEEGLKVNDEVLSYCKKTRVIG